MKNKNVDRMMEETASMLGDDDELVQALKKIVTEDPSPNAKMFGDAYTTTLTLIARTSFLIDDELAASTKVGQETLDDLKTKYGDLKSKFSPEEELFCERAAAVIQTLQWTAVHMRNLLTQAAEVFTRAAEANVPELGKMIRDKQAAFDKLNEDKDFEDLLANFSKKKAAGEVLPS